MLLDKKGNLVDVIAYITSAKKKEIEYPKPAKDGSNKAAFYVSGEPLEHFELNSGGHIRSDISIIKAQTDLRVQQAMLSQMTEIPADNPNAGLSDQEILMRHHSKYMQSPCELQYEIESQLIQRENEVKAAQVSTDDNNIKFDSQDGNVEPNS